MTENSKTYFYGLDTVRFVCAMIVVMGHFRFEFPLSHSIWRFASVLWDNLFNGPAAVIVFFIVSGFVIHLPQASRKAALVRDLRSYYTKRFLRIVGPSVFALILFILSRSDLPGVLWSVICEGIYYAIYPLLLPLARKLGWKSMIGGTTLLALALALFNLDTLAAQNNGYDAFAYQTWIIGLPVWLMGCWLAEEHSRFPTISTFNINIMRLGLLLLTVVLRVVKFHVPPPWGSNVIWLNFFAFAAVVWLGFEIAYNRKGPQSRLLEYCGTWSFSLYLVHPVINTYVEHWAIDRTFLTMFLALPLVLALSFAFFLVVEKPFHHMARRAGQVLKTKPLPAGQL